MLNGQEVARVALSLKKAGFVPDVMLGHNGFLTVLQVSRAHVYLTYPFVLSWSMLEALSAGCLVIGSKTPPVEEVLHHRENGLLVDFFDTAGTAGTVVDVLANPGAHRALREQARRSIIEGRIAARLRSRDSPVL